MQHLNRACALCLFIRSIHPINRISSIIIGRRNRLLCVPIRESWYWSSGFKHHKTAIVKILPNLHKWIDMDLLRLMDIQYSMLYSCGRPAIPLFICRSVREKLEWLIQASIIILTTFVTHILWNVGLIAGLFAHLLWWMGVSVSVKSLTMIIELHRINYTIVECQNAESAGHEEKNK